MRTLPEALPERVISAAPATRSILESNALAAREIGASRYVIVRLFLRDFIAQFRQKLLGYFWAVLSPLVAIASFVFMAATGFLNPGEMGYPYTLYVYVGTSIWGTMIATISTVSGGLLGNSELMIRTSIPPIALALAGLANVIYQMLVGMLTLLVVLCFAQFTPSPFIVVYPILLLPIVLVGVGIGLILATIGVVARDITSAVVTVVGLWMYVTPVIYVAHFNNPVLQNIVKFNPITYLVDFPRALVLTGTLEDGWEYLASTAFAIALVLVAVHGFYLIKDKVAERL